MFQLVTKLINKELWFELIKQYGDEKALAKELGLGQRELTEFKTKLNL
jgi:hypothetical protein